MLSLLQTLSHRRSGRPKLMTRPAPTRNDRLVLEQLLSSVPTHFRERGYTWTWIQDTERLAEIFLQELPENATQRRKLHAQEKAQKAPLTLALIIRNDANDEVKFSAGASLMQLLNGLYLLGYSAKTVSAKPLQKDNLLCHTEEQVALYVLVGTPAKAPKTPRIHPVEFRIL